MSGILFDWNTNKTTAKKDNAWLLFLRGVQSIIWKHFSRPCSLLLFFRHTWHLLDFYALVFLLFGRQDENDIIALLQHFAERRKKIVYKKIKIYDLSTEMTRQIKCFSRLVLLLTLISFALVLSVASGMLSLCYGIAHYLCSVIFFVYVFTWNKIK